MKDKQLFDAALNAWSALQPFRARRSRARDFAMGRQWDDRCPLPDGTVVSDGERWLRQGRLPLCNNLIRQLVKSLLGQWRHSRIEGGRPSPAEQDARLLEEFLISGCAVQRLPSHGFPMENVSAQHFFFTRCTQSTGADCTFIGMLHDLPPARMLSLFAGSSPARFARLAAIAASSAPSAPLLGASPCGCVTTDFHIPDIPGTCRVIEVWRKEFRPVLRIHDPLAGSYCEAEWSAASLEEIAGVNAMRSARNAPGLRFAAAPSEVWTGAWLMSDGTLLGRVSASSHPFVMALYPMIDGEVRSLVEDVIDQQKQINNLVMVLDEIIRASAKGVVLFPADQLPRGMTWSDVRKVWSSPGGILPFRRTSKNIMPYQLNTSPATSGASELLKTHLRLFDEISGTNASSRGAASTAKGAEMLSGELRQAAISAADVLSAFDDLIMRRDALMDMNASCCHAPMITIDTQNQPIPFQSHV